MAAVAVGCVLAFGGSAGAAGKQRVVVDQFSEPDEFAVDCSAFGAHDFDNLVSGHQRTRVTEVRAAAGMLLQTVFTRRSARPTRTPSRMRRWA